MCHSKIVPILIILAAFNLAGCGEGQRSYPGEILPTSPVSGIVTVNGQPYARLEVGAFPNDGQYPRPIRVLTDDAGQFVMTTYEEADGLVPGTYSLTFRFMRGTGLGERRDEFFGKFSEAAKSSHTILVEADAPLVIDSIDLTSS